jgi:hypothetical protein
MVATPNKPSAPRESSNATLWQRYEDWLYYHEGLGFIWISAAWALTMPSWTP